MAKQKYTFKNLSFVILLTVCSSGYAEDDVIENLLKMDITELAELTVFMPSRKMERLFDAPAAIYVINQEDIRRSGLTKIPELLRMVPGIHVGQLDNNTWSISSRSAMVRFSNSMLVLLDGRTLYNPLFGGVYWDVQDFNLEDIERIEVIRGPGGTLWGANAFDGIINIISKTASNTSFTTLNAGVGQGNVKHNASIRVGKMFSDVLHARAYVKHLETGTGEYLDSEQSSNTFFSEGDDAFDDAENSQAGFRVDWELETGATLTLQGDGYDGEFNSIRTGLPHENTVKAKGNNIIAKWNRHHSESSSTTVQFYIDYTKREGILFKESRDIYDLDIQNTLSSNLNVLTWGIGVRHTEDDTRRNPTGSFELVPAKLSEYILSAFIQDRIQLLPEQLYLTFGTKFEENEHTGGDIQPSIRILWKIDPNQTLWSSITRAVRMPSRSDLHAQLVGFGPTVNIGNPNFQPESVVATELGYRSQLLPRTLIDIAVFNHNYSDPNNGSLMLDQTYGFESVVNHEVNSAWRLEASLTWHKGTSVVNGENTDNNRIPGNTIGLRSLFNISSKWEFDTFILYKEGLEFDNLRYKDYLRVDARLGWNPTNVWRTSLTVTNIFDDLHAEAADSIQRVNTAIGRSILLSTSYDIH